jgi:ATP-dependent DNA helicase DinG
MAGEQPAFDRAERRLRYTEEDRTKCFWDTVSARLEAVQRELARLVKVNDRALQSLETSRLTEEQIASQALELRSFGARLQGLLGSIDHFRGFKDETQVRWISSRPGRAGRDASLEFASTPIRVAEDLRTSVFDPMSTVVLTSATLSVGGSIDFLGDRLGLSQLGSDRFDFRQLASPFDYRRQVLTFVPTDFPLPESPDYTREIPEAVFRLLCATRGRAFVLFTSFHLLNKTYARIGGRLTALGLRPMAQGEAERSELLDRFRNGTGNVLFGTDSFWEGVDVKGKALESVIITRLPFRVPTEPLQEARMKELEERGLNAFSSFTVPQAVLKFKQGFGRLIRSRSDRGVVAILDRRVVTKPYGRVFLNSLPDTTLVKAPLDEIVGKVERFFATEDAVEGEVVGDGTLGQGTSSSPDSPLPGQPS